MANSSMPGLDDWLDFLTDSPKKMQLGARAGLYAGAQLIEAQAKANCPVGAPAGENAKLYGGYVGALRDSIRVTIGEKGSRVFASVKAGGNTTPLPRPSSRKSPCRRWRSRRAQR